MNEVSKLCHSPMLTPPRSSCANLLIMGVGVVRGIVCYGQWVMGGREIHVARVGSQYLEDGISGSVPTMKS